MRNWSTDTTRFTTAEARERFLLEQKINYGLQGKKISRVDLKKHWVKLSLDPVRRRLLALFLYEQKQRDTDR